MRMRMRNKFSAKRIKSWKGRTCYEFQFDEMSFSHIAYLVEIRYFIVIFKQTVVFLTFVKYVGVSKE